MVMKISEIIRDAVRYPLVDWKKILILGIILVMSTLYVNFLSTGVNIALIILLGLFGLLMGIFTYGYEFRILESSLNGFFEPPEFNAWFSMFIDGLKVIVVGFVYAIPLILIIIFAGSFFGLAVANAGINYLHNTNMLIYLGIIIILALLYLIVTFPLILMSLANMAYNEDIGAAFKFGEISNKISNKGWGNFIIWYVVTGLIYIILMVMGAIIEVIFNLIHLKIVGSVLFSLIILPYMGIYLYRSAALFYLSGVHGYLECEKCGGYYELQEGESPDDFEKCQCGGNLNYYK